MWPGRIACIMTASPVSARTRASCALFHVLFDHFPPFYITEALGRVA